MAARGGAAMNDLIWLTKAQMRQIKPYFPLSHILDIDAPHMSGLTFFVIACSYVATAKEAG